MASMLHTISLVPPTLVLPSSHLIQLSERADPLFDAMEAILEEGELDRRSNVEAINHR